MSELNKYDGSIRSYSGEQISIINPESNQYRIIDIAKGLSYKGHFAGQTPYFFSIAEHCLLVDAIYCADMRSKNKTPIPKMRLLMLLHDATEAFLPDMPKPYKNYMKEFQNYENAMMNSILFWFNIPSLYMAEVKKYDVQAQEIEFYQFINRSGSELSPEKALILFLETFWTIISDLIIYEKLGHKISLETNNKSYVESKRFKINLG